MFTAIWLLVFSNSNYHASTVPIAKFHTAELCAAAGEAIKAHKDHWRYAFYTCLPIPPELNK